MITGIKFKGRSKRIEYIRVSMNTKERGLRRDLNNLSLTIKKQKNMATAKKAAAKKAAAPAPAKKAATAVKKEKEGPGKIEQILALHKAGKSNAEIVEKGFNKTTVSIQVAKYKKGKAEAKEAKKAAK